MPRPEPTITLTLSELTGFVKALLNRGDDPRISAIYSDVKAIRAVVATIKRSEDFIMADLTALTLEVHDTIGAEQSALLVLARLEDAIKAAGTDQVALDALTAELAAKRTEIAAAVAASPGA